MRRRNRRAIVWLLAWVMTFSPLAVYAQTPAASAKPKIDLGYVTPETAAAVVAYPRYVLTAPEMEMLPTEIVSAAGKKELGIDPLEVEQILAIAEPPVAGPPGAAIVVRMSSPLPEGKILGPVWKDTEEATLDGKSYRRGKSPMDLCIFRPDDRTIIVGTDALLQKIWRNHANPKAGEMSEMLGRVSNPPDVGAVVLVEPLRPLLAAPLAMMPVPPPLEGVKKVPDLLQSIGLRVNVVDGQAITLSLRANDEAAAKEIEQIVDQLFALGQRMVLAKTAEQAASSDPVEQATAKYTKRMSGPMMQTFRPVRKGEVLTLTLPPAGTMNNPKVVSITMIGMLAGLLLPAVSAAREAGRKIQSANNMKQLGLALLNYESSKVQFPARASFDKAGKPLLSWRVQMLPYLDQIELYKQFHQDEPWDSEHNRTLIEKMPVVFQNPSAPAQPGKTSYLAVCGAGLAFDGAKGRKIAEIINGQTKTILLVEADPDHAVTWTKPDDWQFDAKQPLAGLGHAHPGGFNATFADGAVRFMDLSVDPQAFSAMLKIAAP